MKGSLMAECTTTEKELAAERARLETELDHLKRVNGAADTLTRMGLHLVTLADEEYTIAREVIAGPVTLDEVEEFITANEPGPAPGNS